MRTGRHAEGEEQLCAAHQRERDAEECRARQNARAAVGQVTLIDGHIAVSTRQFGHLGTDVLPRGDKAGTDAGDASDEVADGEDRDEELL